MITLTDQNFYDEMSSLEGPILVDFWANWCGPCRQMNPILDDLDKTVLPVGKVDVDANPALVEVFGISSIPTLILFSEGRPQKIMIGAQSKESLLEEIL